MLPVEDVDADAARLDELVLVDERLEEPEAATRAATVVASTAMMADAQKIGS
ncbi:MAG: hypothetical protein WCK71_01165 [bacterium]